MKKINYNKMIRLGVFGAVITVTDVAAQVATQGLPPAYNTSRAFVDASIVRDSGINQPLDLLNDFYPMIEVTITDHDNIRRRSDISEDDTRIAVVPSLGYRTNIGRHSFYAAYQGVFTYHDDFEEEDSQSNSLTAQLGLDITRHWDLKLFAGMSDGVEERGISGSRGFNQLIPFADRGPDTVEYENYGADLIYGQKVSRLGAVLGIEKNQSRYKNNFQGGDNFSGNRDREQTSIHFDLSYKIGSKTSIFARLQDTDTDYDRSLNSLDSNQVDVLLGLRWKATNALSGMVAIGNSHHDLDDPTRDDYDGSTYYANLNYMIRPFSNIQLSASRAVEEPGDISSDYYTSDLFGVGWNHSITPQLIFNAYAKWVDDDYNTARKDEFFDFGLGLDYVWRPWLTAGLFYGEVERTSSEVGVPYEEQYFGIRLRSDLRSLLHGRGSRVEPESFSYPGPPQR